ncbi:MAG: hypothetical protein JO189_01185, partial [Deltaproteobacteria bacterium]|nr:hypothetical protein [Deltaproteobacteria bacterium]
LLKSKRQQIHSRIARVLEEQFPEMVQAQPELVAHHYTGAGLIAQAIPYWQKAGEQAVQRAAFSEAINYFAEGLSLLPERTGESNSDQPEHELGKRRCELLIAMGNAQRRGGQSLRAQQTLIRAADIAQALISAELVGRAALGLSYLANQFGLPVAPTAIRLFEQTLARSSQDSVLRATILGGLATALATMGEAERAFEYGQQGTEIARRVNDAQALALGLFGILFALQLPQHARQRMAYANEMLESARACDSKELIIFALWWRVYSAFQTGDVFIASRDLEEFGRMAEETREPHPLFSVKNFQACQASIRGQFEECERLAQEALAIGQNLELPQVMGLFGTQMFTLHRELGRLNEVEPILRHFMQTTEGAKAWGPGLALIYAELGRTAEARAQFDQVAASNFADIPQDANWLPCMTYLADVCNFLGDRARAALLYERLLPYKKVAVLMATGSACYGSASRYLGALATTMARWDEAEQYFQDASAMNSAMGARPWLAHTQYQYARMLLTRDQAGDSDRAARLLKDALATARELGMRALEHRITSGSP